MAKRDKKIATNPWTGKDVIGVSPNDLRKDEYHDVWSGKVKRRKKGSLF